MSDDPTAESLYMIETTLDLVKVLADQRLLTQAQIQELNAGLASAYPRPQELMRELVKRGWLTPFQANRIIQGQSEALLLGPYVLLEKLGEGGMGQVFKAHHRLMNRDVALKIIRKERLGSPGAADRFVREIQASANLSHPNIVIAHNADRVGEVLYFAMEYVAGADLDQVIKKLAPAQLPVSVACEYVRQAALGLQHAHERGLVHRDVKPANLLLDSKDQVVKVLDLGLARLSQVDLPSGADLTQEGNLMGTPDYMAPEQAMDCRTADARSDIYSLGCVLYFLLAGRAPFADRPTAQKIGAHINHTPRPIEAYRPDVPVDVREVLRKMMAKQPEARYQSARELSVALAPFAKKSDVLVASVATMVPAPTAVGVAGDTAPTPVVTQTFGPAPFPIAPPTGGLSRRQLLIGGAGAGLAVLLPAGYLLWRRGPIVDPKPTGANAAFRYDWYPPQLVRVLGDDRGRHWGPVRTAAYRNDGKAIASGGDDAVVRVWDAVELREMRLPVGGHTAPVREVVFSPDGKSIVSLGNDGTMRLWDVASGKEVRRYAGSEGLSHLHFAPDGLTVRGIHGTTSLGAWDVTEGTLVSVGLPTGNTLTSLNVVTGGQFVVFAETIPDARSWYRVQIWSTRTRKVETTLAGPEKPEGYELLKPEDKAKVPGQWLVWVTATPDAQRVLGVSNRGEVVVWDGPEKTRRTLVSADQMAVSGELSPDGTLAITQHRDGTLNVWEMEGGKKRGSLVGHKGAVVGITFAPDSRRALTVSDDRTMRQWDLEKCEEVHPRVGHTHLVETVAFSADGRQVVSGGADMTMRLWDAAEGKPLGKFVHKHSVTSVAVLPGGEELFSIDTGLAGRRWAVVDGRTLINFPFSPQDPPAVLNCSRKTPTAIIGHAQGTLVRWDLMTGRTTGTAVAPTRSTPGCLAVSADERYLLAAGRDPIVRYVDLHEGKELKRFGGHTDMVQAVAFTRDGRYALGAGWDGRLCRWELAGDGKLEREKPLQDTLPKVITSMAFSPDATVLACSGYTDHVGLVLVWDVETGAVRYHWRLPGPVHRVTFADDSKHLATANANGTIYLYDLTRQGKK